MIIFSWTLTPNQILALRSVADYHEAWKEAELNRDRQALCKLRLNALDMPQWMTATRGLLREGFIRHSETEWKAWQKVNGVGPQGSTKRQLWEVTEKGRLMLQIVAIEIAEQGRHLALESKQLKILAA